jgi:hypothetical protein
MDKLYIRARLTNGEERHLLCRQPSNMEGADRGEVAREQIQGFIERI